MREATVLFVSPAASMRDVIACIDRNAMGIALVVDEQSRLLGTVTDGDLRRALLAGEHMDTTRAEDVLARKPPAAPRLPLTAPLGSTAAELLELLNRHDLRHIPLVDREGRVAGIELLSDLVHDYELPIRALVMAGGYGTRLRPLTDDQPKSMLPIGNRPLLEVIVDQLQQAGVRRVHFATHYRADMIERHFGNGQRFGVEITYLNEDEPRGTAGALARMSDSDEPLLVMNGDILSNVNLVAMVDFHRVHGAALTIAVRPYEFQVPYGVLRTEGLDVLAVDEKPTIRHLVNAGIYLLQPAVQRLVPLERAFDMTDVIASALNQQMRVISFPLREYWLDIGRTDDYARALSEYDGGDRK